MNEKVETTSNHSIRDGDATLRHSEDAKDAKSISSKEVATAENPIAAAENPPNVDGEPEYATGAKLFLIMTSVCLFVFLVALDQTIVSTAVPKIIQDFQVFQVGWYGSAYLLTSTAFQPLFGRMYQSFDVKIVYLVALCIFEIGSLICGVAQDSTTFIVGRAIAGLGLAGGYSGSMIIVNLAAPIQIRPMLTSIMGATYGVGGTIGPLIGGAFTSHATWRWCFYINLIFFPFVGVAVFIFLKLPKVHHETTIMKRLLEIDWLGSILILSSLICILMVFQWGGVQYAWGSSTIIGLIVGFVVIGIAFLAVQVYMKERATIPFRLFKNRTVGFGAIVNFGIAGAYFGELYFLPIYFQSIRGSSPIRSGVQTLPFIVAVIFAVTVSGGVVNKTGVYIPIIFLGTTMAALGAGMFYFLEPDSSQALWCGLQFFAGLGPGMSWMLPFIASSAALPPADIAIGSAVVIFFQTLGGTIFVSAAQSVFQNKFILYLKEIPGSNADEIIAKGISSFREVAPPALLPTITAAANKALQKDWIMLSVVAAFAFVGTFGMELNRRIPKAEAPPITAA